MIYLYGSAALVWWMRLSYTDVPAGPSAPLIIFIGIIVVTIIAMVAQLFISLGEIFVLSLMVGAILIALRRLAVVRFSMPHYNWFAWIFMALAFLTVLENAVHFAANPDTGLYHAQTIHWFENYRIVPGLGNFQERLAFNSSWLVLNAAFSLAFLGLRSFRLINGLLFLVAIAYFTSALPELARKNLTLSGVAKILFLVLSFYLLGSEISSVGNDMPVSLMTWIVFVLWLERSETKTETNLNDLLIFLLPIFLITVKLSSVPLLLFPLFILIDYLLKRDTRLIVFLCLAGCVILLPWLIRSVILSGYLVFPLSQIDVFAFDWKIPQTQVEAVRAGITGIARQGKDWQPGVPLSVWVPTLLDYFSLNQRMIFYLTLFSPLLLIFERYLTPDTISRRYLFAYGTFFWGSAFWFFSAPDIRFGYGYLICTCVMAILPVLLPIMNKILKHIPILVPLFLLAFQGFTLLQSIEIKAYPERILLPADYRSSKTEACDIHGVMIYCPKTYPQQCQYTNFPCMPYPRPNVEMRGETFQDGFHYSSGLGQ